MAVFNVETKNKVNIEKKPRVYFTCHPDDFERYFKKVCDDIFKTHDCAIYYTEDMTEIIAEDEKQVDLGRNNLFVVPVTFKLLSTPNRAMDEDVPYALKEHIPVLPFMMEPGLDKFYSKPDKFGELQYLNPYSTDLTEISYEEKLKKYLESVLISDELAKRVRAAFDAYIFLSYRKKDRKYANELMRLIHNNPECRDVAIWFDEFLTPGESFRESIDKILSESKLFTLLVTPNLLEEPDGKPNFVMAEEYPIAKKIGIEILPAEMEFTDKIKLKEKFEGIPACVEPYQDETFKVRLIETVTKLSLNFNDTPEHNFLIGLAYLEGIDVEVDRERAVELIISSAEAGVVDAIKKLVTVYSTGMGTECNLYLAITWQKKLIEHYKYIYTNEKNFNNGFDYYEQLQTMTELLYSYSNSTVANTDDLVCNSVSSRNLDEYCFDKIHEILLECKGLSQELCDIDCEVRSYMLLMASLDALSRFYETIGELAEALKYANINLSLYRTYMKGGGRAKYSFMLMLVSLRIGRLLNLKGEFENAKNTLENIPDFYNTLDGKTRKIISDAYLIEIYIELGDANKNLQNFFDAETNYLKGLKIIKEYYKYDCGYAIFYCVAICKLATLYLLNHESAEAMALIDEGIKIITRFEKEYSDIETADCLAKLYEIYGDLHKQNGDTNRARDYYDQAHLIRVKTVDERVDLRLYIPVAILYKKLGEINKDISMLELALDIFEQSCDSCPEIIEYQNEKNDTKRLLKKIKGNN